MFNIVEMIKSRKCADYIWFGMQDYLPFIGFFSDSLVQDAFMRHANCHSCYSDTQFPYEDSQSYPGSYSDGINENNEQKTDNFEVHPWNFLNLKDECKTVYKFLCDDVKEITEDDVFIIKSICSNLKTLWSAYHALQIIHKHLYHGLSMTENDLKYLSETFVGRALQLKDSTTDCYVKSILSVHKTHWTLPAIFSRALLEDLISKLGQDTEMLMYMAHDINLVGLLAFLYGDNNDLADIITYYTSHLELEVLYSSSRDKKYVRMSYNGKSLAFRTCGETCELSELLELMSGYTELGGDLKEFCDA
jgi:hypothetical protein